MPMEMKIAKLQSLLKDLNQSQVKPVMIINERLQLRLSNKILRVL